MGVRPLWPPFSEGDAMRRRRYTGNISCEYCGQKIGGSSKSGLFANYTSHVLAKHSKGN